MAENNDLSAEFPELPMILMKNIIVILRKVDRKIKRHIINSALERLNRAKQ